MISPSIIRTVAPFRLAAFPTFKTFLAPICYHNRQLSTSTLCRNFLSTKQSHQEATSPHKREHSYQSLVCLLISVLVPEELSDSSSPRTSALTKHDAVSTIPDMVRGDWVLFHPVYKPDELKAVEVFLPNSIPYLFSSCLLGSASRAKDCFR